MTARPDLLGLLPFADVADPDPDALPFADEVPSLEVRTMLPGTPRAFDRAFLTCPHGHDMGSSPVTTGTGRRWLAGDYSGEWCGRVGCEWSL